MALYISLSDDDYSDSENEMFVGPLTLHEIHKTFLPRKHRQTVHCITAADDENVCDESLKIIETHSAPNILNQEESRLQQNAVSKLTEVDSSWDLKPNDSFLEIEKMVSNLCLNTTRDIIDQISKEPDGGQKAIPIIPCVPEILINDQPVAEQNVENLEQHIKCPLKLENTNILVAEQNVEHLEQHIKCPLKLENTNILAPETNAVNTEYFTPTKQKIATEMYSTSSEERICTPIFKTPGLPVSKKKLQTPTKRSYHHVVSPVATYIHKSPVVPLMQNVKPKKPLVTSSGIPKPIKSVSQANVNKKENIKLPSIAYKAAKETKMIDIPDEGKLPQTQWAKRLVSSISKVTVIKHDHREGTLKKAIKHQEHSFADLSVHQADVSVCTQRSALINKPKK